MTEAAVTDLGIERLVHIDQRIAGLWEDALRARHEFGCQMLAARDGAGRLPNGYLAELSDRTGRTSRELQYRAKFAAEFSTEEELRNAVSQFASWREVVKAMQSGKPTPEPAEPQEVPEGIYRTFVADPPWRYGNTSTRGAAEDHYPTMSIDELCDIEIVRDTAADEAHLYLWTTAGHLPEAFRVMESWGFEYKTYLVWVKPQMGMGNYFRVSTELVLFGVRGGIRTNRKDRKNWFESPRAKHSAKPPMFHDLVTEMSPGPYLELFSRCYADEMLTGCTCSKCRLGWTVWGNQA